MHHLVAWMAQLRLEHLLSVDHQSVSYEVVLFEHLEHRPVVLVILFGLPMALHLVGHQLEVRQNSVALLELLERQKLLELIGLHRPVEVFLEHFLVWLESVVVDLPLVNFDSVFHEVHVVNQVQQLVALVLPVVEQPIRDLALVQLAVVLHLVDFYRVAHDRVRSVNAPNFIAIH